ncbi:NAD/NADP octopine/nopaline dehydrogenase family protein [Erysipelatoclostridium ramosum]|uniref:NAD/NADP-dependent octopine/nopaline dehydrogenase family protein n=1 Tax=Thomasclavelia ramosa TaxID=1547 RepID=UPI00192AABBB|nr:NAD/NADP-dependent octopine/nopaline dehydrogenase family protein [Thomasclavelia ramosa]MCR1948260.1 NAD/NADP octopine/nopaline dehydrogenase family protein [Thomasclavelia ramosa]QQY28474.1 NAD/NADP octopine/nopaline dehydrogenase family protein [Thomasclavelia ramosa]
MKITIIGGGNLGTLMGAMFAHKRNEVTIHTSKPEKYEKKIEVYNNNEEFLYSGILSNVTSNWKEAIEEAELIWITVPPQLFFDTAKLIEPYIKQGQMIGLVPGAGAAEFAFAPLIEKGVKFFGLARVPSIARLKEYGKSVYMLGPAPELLVGSIPANNSKEICTAIQPLFDMVCRPLANYLVVAFTPSNPVLHTSRIYAMFKDYMPDNVYPNNELFYEAWTIDGAEVLLNCSDELQQLCKAIPMDMRDVESMQSRHNIRTPEELATRICSLDRLKGLYSPVIKTERGYVPDFDSRYFVSDFPYGIKIMITVADLFNVETPTMDKIWEWYKNLQPERAEKCFELDMTQEEFIKFYTR